MKNFYHLMPLHKAFRLWQVSGKRCTFGLYCKTLQALGYRLIMSFILAGTIAGAVQAQEQTDHAGRLPKERIVMAIIGEAESGGLDGMRCVASAIINRGTLKGVYGERSKRVREHLYSPHTFVLAVQAYEDSLKHDYSGGADTWGNKKDLIIFRQSKWFKKCKFIKQVGGNYFYRCGR